MYRKTLVLVLLVAAWTGLQGCFGVTLDGPGMIPDHDATQTRTQTQAVSITYCSTNTDDRTSVCGAAQNQCNYWQYGLYSGSSPANIGSTDSVCCYDSGKSFCSIGGTRGNGTKVAVLCPQYHPIQGYPMKRCGMNCIERSSACNLDNSKCTNHGFATLCIDKCADTCGSPSGSGSNSGSNSGSSTPSKKRQCPRGKKPCGGGCFNPKTEKCATDMGNIRICKIHEELCRFTCFDPSVEHCINHNLCPLSKDKWHKCTGCYRSNTLSMGASCNVANQCRTGFCGGAIPLFCTAGHCSCNDDNDCGSGEFCYQTVVHECRPKKVNSKSCTKRKHCLSGRCYLGFCRACSKDSHCATGQTCNNGACQ